MPTWSYTPVRDVDRPLLPIALGNNSYDAVGLVDSGASNTIFDSQLAVGIDLSGGDKRELRVGGGVVLATFVTIQMTVMDFSWEGEVGFVDNWSEYFGLLGESFFRYWTVTFRFADKEFDLEPIDM